MAAASLGSLVILVWYAPGEGLLQKSRVLLDPALLHLSLYLLAAGCFGVAYAARTLIMHTPQSRWCFWIACALLAWLVTEILLARQVLFVLHLPTFAVLLYASLPPGEGRRLTSR